MESKCTIDKDGDKYWRNSAGKLHRENDLPAIEFKNGNKFWLINGEYRRENGLHTIEYFNKSIQWYSNKCSRHREDGPAIIYASGLECWYINGIMCTPNECEYTIKMPLHVFFAYCKWEYNKSSNGA